MLPPPTLRRRRGASTDRIVLLKFPYEMQALTAGVSAGLGIFSLGMSGIAGGDGNGIGKIYRLRNLEPASFRYSRVDRGIGSSMVEHSAVNRELQIT